jgi:hypothetical protein
MKIIANPKLLLIHFDFQVGNSHFDVELKQYLDSSSESDIVVHNKSGEPIKDQDLIKIIKDYCTQKYSILYDEDPGYVHTANSDVRLDPPI